MKNKKNSKINRNNIEVKVKLTDSHGVVHTYLKGTASRFLSKLRGSLWSRCVIRVSYGKQKDVYGKMVEFTNEGEYDNKHDAIQAFKAFLEV